jgi:hypothetical protein
MRMILPSPRLQSEPVQREAGRVGPVELTEEPERGV